MPQEAIYLNLDDLNKEEAPVYQRSGEGFSQTGEVVTRRSRGRIYRRGDSKAKAEAERLAREEELRIKQEAEARQKAQEAKEAKELQIKLDKQQTQKNLLDKQARRETAITSVPTTTLTTRRQKPQSSVEAYNPSGFRPESQQAPYTRRSAIRDILTGKTLGNTFESAKKVVRLEAGVGSVFGSFFEPLKYTGKQKGETVVQLPQRGTVNVNAKTETTLFELERERKIASGVPPGLADLSKEAIVTDKATKESSRITKEYQARVDSGELTVDEATKQAQKEYSTSISDYESKIPKNRNLRKRSGESVVKTIEIGGELATFAVAGRLSPGSVASSIDRTALSELSRKSYKTFGQEIIRSESGSVVIAKQSRNIASASESVSSFIPTFRQGTNRVTVGGGRIIRRVELDSFKKAIQGYSSAERKIIFTEEGSVSAKLTGNKVRGVLETDFAKGITLQKELEMTKIYGKSDFVSKGLTRTEYVATRKGTKKVISSVSSDNLVKPSVVSSVVKENEKTYDFIAGKPNRIRFYPQQGKASIVSPIEGQGKILKYQEGVPRSQASLDLEESLYGGAKKDFSIKGLDTQTRNFVKSLKSPSVVQEEVSTGSYSGPVIKQSVKNLQTPTLSTKTIPKTVAPEVTSGRGKTVQVSKNVKQIEGIKVAQAIDVVQTQQPKVTTRTRTATKNLVALSDSVAQKSDVAQTVSTKTVLVKKLKLKNKTITTPSLYTGSGYGFGGPPTNIRPPIIIPVIRGGGARRGRGVGNVPSRYGGSQYTPSFTALFFKVRGKAPRGPATGIRFRPITPGFSFQKVRRIRRIKV